MLHIITGKRGIGKTTTLLAYIEDLKGKGVSFSGIVTPPVFNRKGEKTGFDAKDIKTGESWALGRSDKKLDGPQYGPFSFSQSGFAKTMKSMKLGLESSDKFLFLDEIGPLELHRKKGFYSFLPEIDEAALHKEISLVIRPELIDEFLEKYIKLSTWRIIGITKENRNGKLLNL